MNRSVLLSFEKLNNARDLGGMKCRDGRKIRRGRLIRSEHLAAVSESDIETLGALVGTVIDLRTDGEKNERPDVVPLGANIIHVPIIDRLTAGITPYDTPDTFLYYAMKSDPELSKKYMCRMYAAFAQSEYSVSQFARFMRHLLTEREKAVLFHCTAGKDRAGTASMIIETVLGVDEEDIDADYLMTNVYLDETIERMIREAEQREGISDENADRALRYLFSADKDYMNAFRDSVDRVFGSFSAFIKNGLALSESDIERLKNIYLE